VSARTTMSTTCECVENVVGASRWVPISGPRFTAIDESKLPR